MRNTTFLFISIFLGLALSSFSQSKTYNFQRPEVIPQGEYITLQYSDSWNAGSPGEPAMPYIGIDILLPQGTKIDDFTITNITYFDGTLNGTIAPVQKPLPFSQPAPENYKAIPNQQIYGSNNPWPLKPAKLQGTHYLAGHSIGTFTLCPAIFHPLKNEITLIKSITVSYKNIVSTDDICNAHINTAIAERLDKITENSENRSSYIYQTTKDSEQIDLLIISSETLMPHFQEYINYKNSSGYFVATETVENIYSSYEGQDDQEKIRNCIIDYYENHQLAFVILGGDADPTNPDDKIIPHRGMKAMDDNDIPSDMYYSNLDGTWDENNNGIWGQIGEGDLYAEVGIGRLCVDQAQEIANMTHKLIMYQDQPVVNDANKVLLVGENLNDNPLTWGGTYMDEIWEGTSNHGFTTAGIGSEMEVSTVYDRDGTWSSSDIRDHFNTTGLNLINHLGHSNTTYNMKMNNSDVTTNTFHNDGITRGYVVGYSQGCYNGAFDNRNTSAGSYTGDCFAEKVTTLETAEVATIANSRYGWYQPANTNASSQFYDRYYFDGIFGQQITQIGTANSYSKEAEISWLDDEYYRWTAYELNLFGDPSMDIWTATPEAMLVSLPGTICAGATSITMESNAPGARIAVLQNGILLGRTFADNTGFATIELATPAVNETTYDISIIAHNKLRFTTSVEVVENTPVIICEAYEVIDETGNGNGYAEYGETASINLTFRNIGDVAATNADFIAVANAQGITFIKNSSVIGALEPGATVTIESAIIIELASDVPTNDISIDISSSEAKGWNSNIILPIGGVVPEITLFEANEISSNPNGQIDAGESAEITFTLKNSGNVALSNISASIMPEDIFVTCENPTQDIATLEAGASVSFNFTITTSEDTPQGFTSFILLNLNADKGVTFADEYFTFVGQPGTLICDFDKNHNSAPSILKDMKDAGASADYITSLPDDITNYKAVFLCLGVFPEYHTLTETEGQFFADYLLQGGNLYVESGSLWFFNDETALQPLMNVTSSIGNGWIYGNETLTGVEDTFGADMIFGYTGDNLRIDDLIPSEPAYLVFTSEPNTFGAMAAQQRDGFKTIATSFEWGGLVDTNPEATTADLMSEILYFLDVTTAKPPVINLGSDTTICTSSQIVLDAGEGFDSYLWSNGSTSRFLTVDTTTFEDDVNIISVVVIDQTGYKAMDEVVISFTDCTGMEELGTYNLNIFPNPTNGNIVIEYRSNDNSSIQIKICDLSGRTIFRTESEFNNHISIPVNLSRENKGVYMMQIQNGIHQEIRKIILN